MVLQPRARSFAAYALVAVCAAVAVLAPDPDHHLRSAARFHDYLHVPGFALVAGLLLWGFPRRSGAPAGRAPLRLVGVFGAAVAVGALVELLQGWVGGDADLLDIGRDAAGAAAAVLAAAAWDRNVPRLARGALAAAALVLLAGLLWPTVAALSDEQLARRQFPVLADFSRASEIDRFVWSDATTGALVRGKNAAPGGRRALRVVLSPGEFPGFAFEYFPRDWRGWRFFVCSCANVSRAPFEITVRIDDLRHNEEYTDRFNRSFVLAPGPNEIRIPLADVEAAPRGRKLDLSQVRMVVIFAYRLGAPQEMLVESLRLER